MARVASDVLDRVLNGVQKILTDEHVDDTTRGVVLEVTRETLPYIVKCIASIKLAFPDDVHCTAVLLRYLQSSADESPLDVAIQEEVKKLAAMRSTRLNTPPKVQGSITTTLNLDYKP